MVIKADATNAVKSAANAAERTETLPADKRLSDLLSVTDNAAITDKRCSSPFSPYLPFCIPSTIYVQGDFSALRVIKLGGEIDFLLSFKNVLKRYVGSYVGLE